MLKVEDYIEKTVSNFDPVVIEEIKFNIKM